MRVLDEVAEAIRRAEERTPRPIVSAFGLREQFERLPVPWHWVAIQRYLACPLPLQEFVPGEGYRPVGFYTIWDLVDHVDRFRPDWVRPLKRTEAAWQDAQIFAGVRVSVAEAGGLDLEIVVRGARLMHDLGSE
jgi:hypothetical protein